MNSMIRVFKVGDCDFIAARNAKEAQKCWEDFLSADVGDGDEPVELSDADMERYIFYDLEPGEPGCDAKENKRTFKAQLEQMILDGDKFPAFFATSEF